MLRRLSGKTHKVITGVTIICKRKRLSNTFSSTTKVVVRKIPDHQIDYYINNYRTSDKAGSYGIQDWIGMIGVENVNGSYTSVLGLPVPQVTNKLIEIINGSL